MIQIPLEIGDTILAGRFKNKKIKVNEIATDDFGNPTVNGRSILKIRIPKLYQKQENEMNELSESEMQTIKFVGFRKNSANKIVEYIESISHDFDKEFKGQVIKFGFLNKFTGLSGNKEKGWFRIDKPTIRWDKSGIEWQKGSVKLKIMKTIKESNMNSNIKKMKESVDVSLSGIEKLYKGSGLNDKEAITLQTAYNKEKIEDKFLTGFNLKDVKTVMPNLLKKKLISLDNLKWAGVIRLTKEGDTFVEKINSKNEIKTSIKENLSPDKLKTIDKKIEWSTEKNLPLSQGSAIKEVIQRYKIPAIKWGYVETGKFIGVETNKQKMFWRDKGAELQFLGILNKDGSVTENKTLKEAVNPFQKSPLEVKIKQTDGSWHIYLQTVDGEECLTMTGWGTKEQAEHAAMMKGYSFAANKSNETPTRETPKYTGYEKVRSEKPEEMKLSKEKKIEIKLEGMMREILGKKKALIEADVTDKPELEAKARRYAEIANKMKQLEAELKAMEPEFEQLDNEFRPLLENIGKTKDTFIRAGKLLIKIERAGYDKNSASYKTGFEYLYNKVNGTMKDLADEALAMTKTVSYVKSKISVVQGESNINEENWLTKIKSFLTNKFKKIFNLNNTANAELSKLEKMV